MCGPLWGILGQSPIKNLFLGDNSQILKLDPEKSCFSIHGVPKQGEGNFRLKFQMLLFFSSSRFPLTSHNGSFTGHAL